MSLAITINYSRIAGRNLRPVRCQGCWSAM
ncbi:MAG: hypothetical protein ACPGAQ_06970 [Candidatus Puniceispirillaceae bacterium]